MQSDASTWITDTVWGLPKDPVLLIAIPVGTLVTATVLASIALATLEQIIAQTPDKCWPEIPPCN